MFAFSRVIFVQKIFRSVVNNNTLYLLGEIVEGIYMRQGTCITA